MNTIIKTLRQPLLFIFLMITTVPIQLMAQSSGKAITGDWKGLLTVAGKSIPLAFHIKDSLGKLVITMDSPAQGATGLICQDAIFSKDSLSLNYKKVIFYKGRLTNPATISGTFTQSGLNLPLNLTKDDGLKDSASAVTPPKTPEPPIVRPQTPKPPFPYVSRDIVYHSPDGKVQYGATITMPDSTGKFPAILLVSGSGQQNRDEEIFGHRPFAVLADFLTRAGYLVMRVDDRGIGKSTGNFQDCTTFDFADDASNSLNYLKKLPQTDEHKLGIIGHSEGGIIAEMLAAKRKDLDFVVLMAAPGIPSLHLQELQRIAATRKIAPAAPAAALAVDSIIFHYAVAEFISNEDTSTARVRALDSLDTYFSKHPPDIFASKGQRDSMMQRSVFSFIHLISKNKWLNQWLRLDATDYLTKIKSKVLALNGSEDFQVTPQENLAGIKAALSNGRCKDFEIKELPGLNHLFQHCNECTLQEYGQLTQTLDPSLLNAITDWLLKKVPINK